MSTKDTIDALSKLENYYLNTEEMELKRLSEEIEYVSKIITTAYVPRFKSAVETLQKIIRIENLKGKRYDYELFNRLWKGSYDVASIKDSCGDIFMDNQKFAEHCDNCNLRFGQSDAFMNTKDLVIVNKCPALSAMNIVLKALKGIVNEQRIDEAYLLRWEDLASNVSEEDAAGCDSEKAARGEQGETVEDRISDFRRKIENRRISEGKDYLSFYYVVASSYSIEDAE